MAIRFNGVRIKPCAAGGGGSSANISNFGTITGDISTKFLAHFDGADGSTTFTDDSNGPLSIAASSGTVQIKNTQSKFGGTSAYFDGLSSNVLRTNVSSKIAFGTADFTIEGWFYFNVMAASRSPQYQPLLCFATDGNFDGPLLLQASTGQIFWLDASSAGASVWSTQLLTTNANIVTNTWHHIAVVGTSTTLRIFVDGVQRGTTPRGPIYTGDYLYLGHYPYTDGSTPLTFNGYIDEVRISNIARYNTSFTPATSAFETGILTYPTAELGLMAKDSLGNLYECMNVSPVTWKEYSSTGVTHTP